MAVQTVACPGCKATLKAPEEMAGKKAKCKKCGVSFRIPGGAAPTGDTEGDSHFLSAMDLPVPAASAADNPFDFGGEPEPEPKPKAKPVEKEKEKEKPVAKKPSSAVPMAEPVPAKPGVKASPKPVAKAKVEEEEIPAAAPVEDDEPAPAASSDPFAFSNEPTPTKGKEKEKEKPKEKDKPKEKERTKEKEKDKPLEKIAAKEEPKAPKPKRDEFAFGDDPAPAGLKDEPDDEEEEEDGKPVVEKDGKQKGGKRGYKTKAGSGGGGGSGKLIIAAVIFGLIVAGGIGGAIIYTNKDKTPEAANNEKKNPDPTPVPAPAEAPGKGDPPKADPKDKEKNPPKADPKDKEKNPPKKDPIGKKAPGTGASGAMLALAPGKPLNFLPLAAKPEAVQEPSNRLLVVPALPAAAAADAFASARKVFPPHKRDIDIGVIWQTAKGLQGVGEKLFLGIYSPQTGKQANQVAFDGDGSPDPVCDLSADANLFAHANTVTGMVSIWDTRSGSKQVDAFNPYATKPGLKLAAVYLTEPPLFFVTVSETGAVHAFNVKSKEPMPGEFVPMKPPAKKLVAGKHIAAGPTRQSVVLFVGGAFFAVGIGPNVTGAEVARLDGDVGRAFGLATSGGQKLLFAFETDDKKDKVVMEVRADGNHVFHRWPDKDAGEPVLAGWVDDGLAMVASDRGSCIWFESEGKDFRPIGIARTPNDKGRHVASDGHWTLLPDPANPKQCVLVEYSKPQSGLIGALDSVKTPPNAILTDKGLFK